MKRTITLLVKFTVDDSIEGHVSDDLAAQHVREAASSWGGQYNYEHWNWPQHIKVTVKPAGPKPIRNTRAALKALHKLLDEARALHQRLDAWAPFPLKAHKKLYRARSMLADCIVETADGGK